MKRLISVIILVALTASLIAFEQIYTKNVFNQMIEKTQNIIQMLSIDTQNIDTDQNIKASEELDKFWDNKKNIMQIMYSQLTVNDFEMKLARTNAAIRANEYPMALTELEQIYRSCFEQLNQIKPHLRNIL